MQRSSWGLLALLVGVASSAHAKTVELKYSSGVPKAQSDRLNQDLIFLDTLPLKDSDGELKRLYKVDEVSAEKMKEWLSVRAKYVIDQNHPLDMTSIVPLKDNVEYPFPGEMPSLGMNRIFSAFHQEAVTVSGEEPAENEDSSVVMSNISGVLYMFGKQSKALIGFNIEGQEQIEVRSPRVGVFRIGAGLFRPISKQMPPEAIQDRVHTLYRLSSLFHESRHADSRRKTLAFPHAVCPNGHPYQGALACDTPANGPYRLDALFMRSAREACVDCSEKEKEVLTLIQLDSESRVLSSLKAGEPSAAPREDSLCAFMASLNINPDFCAVAPSAGEVVEWDDETESL